MRQSVRVVGGVASWSVAASSSAYGAVRPMARRRHPEGLPMPCRMPRRRGAVPEARPEQRKTEHDRSSVFSPGTPAPSSSALPGQPDEGRVTRIRLRP